MSLGAVVDLMRGARSPEDVFGPAEHARAEYRRLAKVVHPDVSGDEAAFVQLERWWRKAEARMGRGVYGTGATEPVAVLSTKRREYRVFEQLGSGGTSNLFHCEWDDGGQDREGVLKVVRDPRDGDLLRAGAAALRRLDTAFAPSLVESLDYGGRGGRRAAAVLGYVAEVKSPEEWRSLEEVGRAFPAGVHPQDMAWMWRRVLMGLSIVHGAGVVHGAVLPPHVLVHPRLHGLALVGWGAASTVPARLRAVTAAYEPWYPPDAVGGDPAAPSLDVYMGARCMVALMGGDPLTGDLPAPVPPAVRAFFKGCLLKNPGQRPHDAHALLREFDDLVERLWGRRRFRPFAMPE